MSELKELFNDIKSIFKSEGVDIEENSENIATTTEEFTEESKEETTEETVKEKFEDVVLADGSVAQIEPDVSLGAAVVVDVDGELLPAPDGDHELADGRVISTEAGVIVAVEEAEEAPEVEAEEEEEEEEMSNTLTEAQEREAKKIIESIVTERVFGMEATISEENNELKAEIKILKDSFAKLLELTEKLINEPANEAVVKRNSAFKSLKKENKKDIISVLKSKKIIN
tara:strand:- start:1489 stop:2172 length:684 start_codon:yes stop_codon:yes gene_type:complete